MPAAVETMAYAGELPWHGLGVEVLGDLTPEQMLEKAGLDWTVEKLPSYSIINGEVMELVSCPLIRNRNGKQEYLGEVPRDWNTVQNAEAFAFFNEFVAEGEMSMETAGSLDGGQLVWGLAKIGETFEVLRKKDPVEAYLLFTNPHKYGWSTSVSLTAIRVVCKNTLVASLNTTKGDRIIRVSHRKVFNAEEVKEVLEISRDKFGQYKERAQFLAKKKAKDEDVVTYFKRLFPVITTKVDPKKDISKTASRLLDVLPSQPGADIAPGTWWNAFNAVTFHLDHQAGREDAGVVDRRLTSAWYGDARQTKNKAMNLATEMANAA